MSNKLKDMTQLQVRIDKKTKNEAKKVLEEIGLNITTVIRVLLKQIVIRGHLPEELLKYDERK